MMLRQSWTSGIHDLVETLTCRVRVLSLNHIRRGWSEQIGPSEALISTVQQLVKADLLVGDVWNLPPSPINESPIAQWSPGDADPELIRLEHVIRTRWDGPVIPTPVVAATHKAARLFGSSTGGLPPENHRNHDLLLSEVYLEYRCLQPELANGWLGEDAVAIAERGVKNPDAFLFDERGVVVRVIESAGRYSLAQLDSFHKHCKLADLPYELW